MGSHQQWLTAILPRWINLPEADAFWCPGRGLLSMLAPRKGTAAPVPPMYPARDPQCGHFPKGYGIAGARGRLCHLVRPARSLNASTRSRNPFRG